MAKKGARVQVTLEHKSEKGVYRYSLAGRRGVLL